MSTSTCTSSTLSESSTRERKLPAIQQQIGYTLEELNKKRNEPKWKVARYTAIALFWGIWAALLAGSILIIVLNNHDVSTTAAPTTTTTKGK